MGKENKTNNNNKRLRYKNLSGDEKKGLDMCLLNVGEISVVYYSRKEKNQIVVHFQHTDTHMIIDHTLENSNQQQRSDGSSERVKFEIILSEFDKESYFCHDSKTLVTYQDAEVSELEYIENSDFLNFIVDLRLIISSNIKIFLIHIISNKDVVLNQYLKVGQIGHSERKAELITHFDIDIQQDENIEFIKFADFSILKTK